MGRITGPLEKAAMRYFRHSLAFIDAESISE